MKLALLALLLAPLVADESLEDLLRRAREKEQALQAQLQPRVERIVQGLESLSRPPAAKLLAALQAEMEQVGSEGAPLFLPFIDPGNTRDAAAQFRARQITLALLRMDTSALTAPLIDMSVYASSVGQANAIELLGNAPLRDKRAHRHLVEIFGADDQETRRAAARALTLRPTPDRKEFLKRALDDPDPKIVGVVAVAIAERPHADANEALFALLERPTAAAPWTSSILNYLRAGTAPLEDRQLGILVDRVTGSTFSSESRAALLLLLPKLEKSWPKPLVKRLKPLTEVGDYALKEAALVCLANMGDRSSRKELLRDFDKQVAGNQRWPAAYEKRGRILLAIGDPRGASKDFAEAIDLTKTQGREAAAELWIELARAYVLDKKLRQAFETLQEARLNPGELAPLNEDPDFQPLREHARYGRLFPG